MGPGEQLRPPGRLAGPNRQERHVGLAAVEGVVERRKIGDLQRDDDQARRRGQKIDRHSASPARGGEPKGQQRGARLPQCPAELAGLRPQQERETEEVEEEPAPQLGSQDHRGVDGAVPAPALVRRGHAPGQPVGGLLGDHDVR